MEGLNSSHLSGHYGCRAEGSGDKNLFWPSTAQGQMKMEEPGIGPGEWEVRVSSKWHSTDQELCSRCPDAKCCMC